MPGARGSLHLSRAFEPAHWEERDPQSQRVIAIKNYISTYEQTRTIWLDDRPHPSEYAAHTWMGFSTGKWEGDVLTIYTTHIKQGWVRRNGLPESDQATLVEHFIRHGDHLTHVSIASDPVYLTEPLIKTQDFNLLIEAGQNWLYPCEYVVEIANQKKDKVPNYLPGENPFLHEFADRYKLPLQAALGGAETMYPEYRHKLASSGSIGSAASVSAPRPRVPSQKLSEELQVLKVSGQRLSARECRRQHHRADWRSGCRGGRHWRRRSERQSSGGHPQVINQADPVHH